MNFYHSDIFAILRANAHLHNFRLLDERVGILPIFGDNFTPKCMLIESWNRDLDNFSHEENDAINIAKNIYHRINLPFYFLKYSDDEINNQTPIIAHTSSDLDRFYSTNIYDFFTRFVGDSTANFEILSDSNKYVHKAINDRISTPFHAWQRHCLHYDGFPVDIDMIYCDSDIRAVVEIKRSFMPHWKPYKADEKNYLALCKLCNALEVNFFLFFVPQEKRDGIKIDDYNRIKIYDIYHRIGGYQNSDDLVFKERGEISLNELIAQDFGFFRTPLPNNTWMKN